MSYIVTTITTRPSTTAKFIRDLEDGNALKTQAAAITALKKAAPGFVKRQIGMSVDGLTANSHDVWVDSAAAKAFQEANADAMNSYLAAVKAFSTEQGLHSVTTSITV